MVFVLFFFLIVIQGHFLIAFLEREEQREEGRERNIEGREKHQLVASHTCLDWASYTPRAGLNLRPRPVPWLGIELSTFQFQEDAPTNSHARQDPVSSFLIDQLL